MQTCSGIKHNVKTIHGQAHIPPLPLPLLLKLLKLLWVPLSLNICLVSFRTFWTNSGSGSGLRLRPPPLPGSTSSVLASSWLSASAFSSVLVRSDNWTDEILFNGWNQVSLSWKISNIGRRQMATLI